MQITTAKARPNDPFVSCKRMSRPRAFARQRPRRRAHPSGRDSSSSGRREVFDKLPPGQAIVFMHILLKKVTKRTHPRPEQWNKCKRRRCKGALGHIHQASETTWLFSSFYVSLPIIAKVFCNSFVKGMLCMTSVCGEIVWKTVHSSRSKRRVK